MHNSNLQVIKLLKVHKGKKVCFKSLKAFVNDDT
jgi:hypothetical protein